MDKSTFSELTTVTDGPHVSIYAPMHVRGADTRENPIRFKNRIREARERLERAGVAESEIDALLEPAEALVSDTPFWQHQTEGLALLLAPDREHLERLPYEPPEETVVGPRFHLKPLVPLLNGEQHYHLLVADLNGAALYRASQRSLERLELPDDTPKSLEEATRFDVHEKSLQHHGDVREAPGGRGAPQGIFHGSGDETRDKKADIQQWFAWLDNGVRETLADEDDLPLLFAGVDYLFPIYRDADKTGRLHDEPLTGASEGRSEEALLADAWEVIGPVLRRPRIEALQRYDEIKGTDDASDATDVIVPAAAEGRVDTMIVGMGAHLWGRLDVKNRSITLEDRDGDGVIDLLDLAATETVTHGGTVWVVPRDHVPGGGDAVAILRY